MALLARAGAAADDRKDRPRAGRAALMLEKEGKSEAMSASGELRPLRVTAPGNSHASAALCAADRAGIANRNIVNLKTRPRAASPPFAWRVEAGVGFRAASPGNRQARGIQFSFREPLVQDVPAQGRR
jgi:hypothetical protein